MVRFRSFLGRNVLRRPSKDESLVYPYREQPESPGQSETSLPRQDHTSPIPAVPFVVSRTELDPDSKVDLSATYSPTSASDIAGFPVAPPGYVSREPSVSRPQPQRSRERMQVYALPTMPSRPSPPAPPPAAPSRAPPAPHGAPAVPSATSFGSAMPRVAPTVQEAEARAPSSSTQFFQPPPLSFVSASFPPPMPAASAPAPPSTAQSPSQPHPAPGDLPLERTLGQKVTAEELHELADWIRQRYQLDIQIHAERNLRARDRDITQAKIMKAEALLTKITRTVDTWNQPQYFEHGTGDYEAFQEVVRRIHEPGKRDWVNEPPWASAGVGRADRRRMV